MRRKTIDAARGSWRGILDRLGIDKKLLNPTHGPCPMCGGKDRFRFDNKGGDGTYICSQCGAGKGMDLLMKFTGWDFATAARAVDEVIGNVDPDPPGRSKPPPEKCLELSRQLWAISKPVMLGDPVHRYLASRGCAPAMIPDSLRYADACPAPSGQMPAMVAAVQGLAGEPVVLHRTFLGPNGKADMENPRRLMPGELSAGCAVRLGRVDQHRLGIAEGIETALAASIRFGIPVWSALNSTMLAKWEPPTGVTEVHVFGDNDAKFGGQLAAFTLAHKLALRPGLTVIPHIPQTTGTDWADREAA